MSRLSGSNQILSGVVQHGPELRFPISGRVVRRGSLGSCSLLEADRFRFPGRINLLPAHRSLLAARSPVFAAMLNSGLEEAQTGQVQISDSDPETFALFLRFLYVGKLENNIEKTVVSGPMKMKLFALADKYQVETLMKICQNPTGSTNLEEKIDAFLSC